MKVTYRGKTYLVQATNFIGDESCYTLASRTSGGSIFSAKKSECSGAPMRTERKVYAKIDKVNDAIAAGMKAGDAAQVNNRATAEAAAKAAGFTGHYKTVFIGGFLK